MSGDCQIVDSVDSKAAIIYPIVLEDRLEVILRIYNQDLKRYSVNIERQTLYEAVNKLRESLVIRSRWDFIVPSQKLYDWLIEPIIADLQASDINTLVFIPNGPLRNLPLSTLHDGQKYLIESFSVVVSPGNLQISAISHDHITLPHFCTA